ncbi:MAG: lipid-A-disaccharide synthase [Acidobacteriota bacterium]
MSEIGTATVRQEDSVRRILIVAGEASGDRYGAGLIRAIRLQVPGVQFTGIGGRCMREAGLDPLMDTERIAVLGFFEVLTTLPRIHRALNRCIAELDTRPDLVLLIDYPTFNLRLAKRAAAAGIPVVYFVSPQIWAWKPGRIKAIAEAVQQMLVIFPFEEKFYSDRGVKATFVGHPLLEILKTQGPRLSRGEAAERFGLDAQRRIIGLLPGSRMKEVRRNLPPILGAARRLRKRFPDLQFLMPVASTLTRDGVAAMVDLPGVVFTEGGFYEALNMCEVAAVSSGTATMEVGLLGVPMVVVYRLHPLTYGVGRHMTHLDTFGMVNLVAGSRIVPELIQNECTPEKIADALTELLSDRVLYERTRRNLRALKSKLGGGGAFDKAARVIMEALR